jgi:acyl-CoA hydrolase
MDWKQEYKRKLVSVEDAAAVIKSGDRIWFAPCSGAPIQLLEALADRVDELQDVHVISGLYLHPFKFMKDPKFIGRINAHTMFYGPYERNFFKVGNITINSVTFSKVHIYLRDYFKANVLATEVSPPDDEGYMTYGAMGVSWNGMVADAAERIVVQVNKAQPKVNGIEHRIHVSKVDAICEFDHPLPPLPLATPTETDNKIADNLVPYIPDGATIQFGVGGLANAIGYRLESKKNLSIHTEMFTDSMMHLVKVGAVTGKMVAGFGLGSVELYNFMADPRVELIPNRIVNDPSEIAKVDNFVSINGTLMADLTGQACSESVGFFQYSSTGGQLDFVTGASLSKGGKSFLCLPSTIETKDGIKSTITSELLPGAAVTTPRSAVMYMVTEHGVADLYLRPIPERVKAMIGIAHPDFREQLMKEAKEKKLLMG